jgi:hypothetical protein
MDRVLTMAAEQPPAGPAQAAYLAFVDREEWACQNLEQDGV